MDLLANLTAGNITISQFLYPAANFQYLVFTAIHKLLLFSGNRILAPFNGKVTAGLIPYLATRSQAASEIHFCNQHEIMKNVQYMCHITALFCQVAQQNSESWIQLAYHHSLLSAPGLH
jgi:hypothetical protein